MIGYLVEQELGNRLPFEKPLASLLTMIEVDPDDPAFTDPSKPIGPLYSQVRGGQAGGRAGLGVQARRGQHAPGGALPGTEADLRAPADPVAAGPGLRSDLRGRRRNPGRLPAGPAAGGGRGGDRQGPGQRPARPRRRRRHPDHGHRRAGGVHRVRHPPAAGHRAGESRRAARRVRGRVRGRVDAAQGDRRVRLRQGDRASPPRSARWPTSTPCWPAPQAPVSPPASRASSSRTARPR